MAVLWPSAGAAGTIDPRSGRLVLLTTDLVVPAGPVSLQWGRALNGQPGPEGMLGSAWRSNWGTRLITLKPNFVIVEGASAVTFVGAVSGGGHVSRSGDQLALGKDGRAVRMRADGSKDTFDKQGRLIERDLRNGNKLALRYAANGRLARIDAPYANFLQLGTDARGRVVSVDSSTGATVRYTYDNDRLSEVRVNGGAPLRYAYDDKGNLARIDDPLTGAVQLAYDARGRVLSRRWADGAEERFEYDDAAHLQRRIDPTGAVTVTQWSPDRRRAEVTEPRGGKIAIAFDSSGRAESIAGPGGTAKIMRDPFGRTAALHDPHGGVTRFEYAGTSEHVKSVTRPDGTRESLEYDPQQNLTVVKAGAQTLAAVAYHPDGSPRAVQGSITPEQRMSYDAKGRLQTLANALGERMQINYDSRGNPQNAVDPLGGTTAWQWDAQGRLLSETDPVGAVTRYEYDAAGRLARSIDPIGGATRFEYDARGRLLAETNAVGQATRYEYDRAGRMVKLSAGGVSDIFRFDPAGNLAEWVDGLGRRFQFERDALGRVTREKWSTGRDTQYRYDPRGRLAAIEDSSGGKVEWQHGANGEVIAERNALGATTQFQYDAQGRLIGSRDARGQSKQFAYTAGGLLARVQEPSGDAAEYRYDAAGRMVETVRPSGGTSKFNYNALGQLTREVDPLGNERRDQRDKAGRIVASTDANGRTTQFAYDAAGRLTEKRFADGKRVTFKYDITGNLLEADDGVFPVRRQYDRAERLTRVEYPALKKSVAYEYDAAGLRTKLVAPDGRETRYEYDAHKRLAAIIAADGKRIALGYDPLQRLSSIQYPNGVSGRWDYDAASRVTRLAYADASGKPLEAWTYRYDAEGNPLQQQDAAGRSTTYDYDAAGQLTSVVSGASTTRYRYGRGGARAGLEAGNGAISYRHDAADRLIEAGPEQLSHDKNGNLVRRQSQSGTTSYEYDAEDRLVKVQLANGKATTFGYAPTGERVWMRDADGLTYYLYDGFDLVQELNDKGGVTAAYTHGPGIDRPLAMQRDSKTAYYHADRLGSVRVLTDERGRVIATYDYDAFGRLGASKNAVANPFTFTGREWDSSTGLYYHRARYYDPALGRFLTPDPVRPRLDDALTANPYIYARNSPLRFVDAMGLAPEELTPGLWELLQQSTRKDAIAILRHDISVHEQVLFARSSLYSEAQLAQKQAHLDAMKGILRDITSKTGRTYTPPSARSFAPPKPGPLTRFVDKLKGFFGGGGTPPAAGGNTIVINPGKGGSKTPAVGRKGTTLVVIAGTVLLGGAQIAHANPEDQGRLAGELVAGTAESIGTRIFCGKVGVAIGGCLAGPPGAAAGGWIGGLAPDVVGVGGTVVDIVDAVATSNIPPPPLPIPALDGADWPGKPVEIPSGPPPRLPRPGTDPRPPLPEYLQPSPGYTPAQLAAAQGLAGQVDGGIPGGAQGKPGKGGQPGGQQGGPQGGYLEAPPSDKPREPPRDPLPPDMCPAMDEAGNVRVWVPCPPGVFPGTPLPPQSRLRPGTSVPLPPRPGASAPLPPTPPVVPGTPPVVIAQTPPVTPLTPPAGNPPVKQPTPPTTPPAPPATGTGAQCSPPLCREMSYENCKRTSGAQTCGGASASLPSCFSPDPGGKLSDAHLAQLTPEKVQAACYQNMLKRCNEGEAGGSGGWCVRKGKEPSCDARARRSCG